MTGEPIAIEEIVVKKLRQLESNRYTADWFRSQKLACAVFFLKTPHDVGDFDIGLRRALTGPSLSES